MLYGDYWVIKMTMLPYYSCVSENLSQVSIVFQIFILYTSNAHENRTVYGVREHVEEF